MKKLSLKFEAKNLSIKNKKSKSKVWRTYKKKKKFESEVRDEALQKE